MVKKTIKKIVKAEKYKVVLQMAGNEYVGEGKTLFEAMDKLNLEWQQIKAKGIMVVTYGNKKVEKLFYLKPLRRIFANKLTKMMQAKNLITLLKETAPMSE